MKKDKLAKRMPLFEANAGMLDVVNKKIDFDGANAIITDQSYDDNSESWILTVDQDGQIFDDVMISADDMDLYQRGKEKEFKSGEGRKIKFL